MLVRITTVALVLAACSGTTQPSTFPPSTIEPTQPPTSLTTPTESPQEPTTTQEPPVDPLAPPFVASGDDVDGPGTYERTLRIADTDRRYVLHVSTDGWPAAGVPLVIDLHGLSATSARQESLSGFRDKADAEGFVVVQPQADGLLPTWQAGIVPSSDVDFLRAVVADVSLLVDVGPVFVAGFSNGGGMAHRIACDAPDLVEAIGTVAGAYPDIGPCGQAVPVIAFHGERDRVAPFEGAGVLLPDVTVWAASWAERSGCDGSEVDEITIDVERRVWTDCGDDPVVLYVVADGRHGWPGTDSPIRLLDSTTTISATELMWEFFMTVVG